MRAIRLPLLLLALAFCLAPVSASDEAFVRRAAEEGLLEVELGRYAAEHARRGDVQAFGVWMAETRGQAGRELESLARDEAILIPQQLSSDQRVELDALTKREGLDFDRAYMARMLAARERDLAAFRSQANGEGAVAQWAGTQLPTVEWLLGEAQRVAIALEATLAER